MHLADLQQWFTEQLFNPAQADQQILSTPNLSALQRISIYAQQYWQRLLPFLQKSYPTLLHLFGPTEFDELIAKPYLLAFPPDHWSLSKLGSRLPYWIERHYHEEDKILVYQASLVDESFTRIRSTLPLPNDLSAPFYLQSHITLLALDADLFTFRKELLQQKTPTIDWGEKRYFACCEEITSTQYLLLKAFEKGATIEEACSQIDSAPDIADWFKTWAERGWFCEKN